MMNLNTSIDSLKTNAVSKTIESYLKWMVLEPTQLRNSRRNDAVVRKTVEVVKHLDRSPVISRWHLVFGAEDYLAYALICARQLISPAVTDRVPSNECCTMQQWIEAFNIIVVLILISNHSLIRKRASRFNNRTKHDFNKVGKSQTRISVVQYSPFYLQRRIKHPSTILIP